MTPDSPRLSVQVDNLPVPSDPLAKLPTATKRHLLDCQSPCTSPLTPKIEALLYRLELVDQAGCGLEAVEEEPADTVDAPPTPETLYLSPSDTTASSSSDGDTDAPQAEERAASFLSLKRDHESQHQSQRRRSRSSSHSELAKTAVGLREIAKKIGRAQLIWDTRPKTVLIVTKLHDEQLVRITKEVTKWLITELGMITLVEERLQADPAFEYDDLMDTLRAGKTDSHHSDESKDVGFWTPEFCASPAAGAVDFVVTLGGDGTVLYAAWMFQKKCPPILPFRLGSLGFLTTFDFAHFRHSIRDLIFDMGMSKGMRMNFRMRFSCTVIRRDGLAHSSPTEPESDHNTTYQILNDLTIDRGPSPYMSQLELFGNQSHLTTIHSDGLTISTPTGSTAYSLSAGGSLVHPDVSAILVTPICPHTLSFRPMILPDTMEVRIMVPEDSRATAWASFDGRRRVCLGRGDGVVVRAGVWPVPTVCWEDQSKDWFKGLERCLGWNKRERQKGFGEGGVGIEGLKW